MRLSTLFLGIGLGWLILACMAFAKHTIHIYRAAKKQEEINNAPIVLKLAFFHVLIGAAVFTFVSWLFSLLGL